MKYYMKKILLIIIALIVGIGSLTAAERTLSGKVTNEKGEPLIGVTIAVKGTTIGTISKSGGLYKLNLTKPAKTLVFRLIGMKTKEVEIGTNDVINVTLDEDVVMTDEIVVTAIGMEREKKSLGYSIEEVKGRTISEAKSVDMINALSGKVAGVTVTNSAGVPGAATFVTIRGITSITGQNQPLFVVDGVPIDNSMNLGGNPDNGTNNLLEGVAQSNRAIDLNPDDIEAISVLKGPAATALYGIRAASGAIIITTKKGGFTSDEKINIGYSFSLQADEVNKLPEIQMLYGQGSGGTTAQPGSRSPHFSFGGLLDTLRYSTTASKFDKNGTIVGMSDPTATANKVIPYDNTGTFFETGLSYNHSLNMAGGNEFGSFYLSLGNLNSSGIVPKSTFDRTSLRLNGEARISSWLKASGNASYINSGGRRIQQGSNVSGVMLGLVRSPNTFDNSNGYDDPVNTPLAYMFANGHQRSYRGESGDGKARYDNPYWTLNMNPFTDKVDRFIGNVALNAMFWDYNMSEAVNYASDAVARLGGDVYTDVRKQIFAIGSSAALTGAMYHQELTSNDYNLDVIWNHNFNISEIYKIKLALGANWFQSSGSSLFTQGDGFVIPYFYHMSNTQSQTVRQSASRLRRNAIYGDLSFNYRDYLYVNGTLRNEASTTLPEENNTFMFGSANISFVFTDAFKETFKNSVLSMGKLRLNYALVGKDAPMYGTYTTFVSAYYADGWTDGVGFPYDGSVGYSMGDVLANSELMPERTRSWEIGLALNFFENMLNFDFTYYNSLSMDQIFNVPIASSSGYWRQLLNAGEISNKGIEIVLNATPYKTKDFKWDIGLNWTKNTNKVEKLAPGIDNLFLGGFSGTSVRAVPGMAFGTIFGPGWYKDASGNTIIDDQAQILNPESGEMEDNPNYGYPIQNPNEQAWGSFNPDWTMGITNSFTWKGLTLSFLFDIRQGGKMWNGTRGALVTFGTAKETDARGTTKVFSGVKGHLDENGNVVSSGAANDVAALLDEAWYSGYGGGFSNNTEDFVEDASWVRLRELSLSYELPTKIAKYVYLSGITVTFTGRNLWLSTDYMGVDPETSLMGAFNAQGIDYFNMPGVKSYIFSLGIKF